MPTRARGPLMSVLRARDDGEAELLRLRRDLMSFVVNEINRGTGAEISQLSGPVAEAIAQHATHATRAELVQLGHRLAYDVITELEPQLAQRLPPLIEQAVETVVANQPKPPPAWLLLGLLAANLASAMLAAVVLLNR